MGNAKAGNRVTGGRFGPGLVITAAFIGPGTVITCSAAGLSFGTSLLWTLLLAGFSTLVLQEMAVRLGLATGMDLAQMLREVSSRWWLRLGVGLLAAGAIAIGCAAYQAGNLVGGAAGLSVLFGGDTWSWVIFQCAVATALLWTGKYKYIERFLIALVVVMSFSFLVTAVVYSPDPLELLGGAVPQSIPAEALPTIMALIGTTVVPYNLFLHSRIVGEKWSGREALGWARRDLILAVAIGVAISMAVMVAASGVATKGGSGPASLNVAVLVKVLRAAMGELGVGVFGAGLWAAGMTSAITAPLAAAYTVTGVAGWERSGSSPRFRAVWLLVMAVGIAFAVSSTRPILLILAAQALNGLILPLAALFLLTVLNSRRLLGELRNPAWVNAVTAIILLIVAALSCRALLGVYETILSALGLH